ncbi:hypothetical protein PPL_12643 [Heterostelium album PN500]|uniref:Uncharacterized protein n=1 Tax=Heterostelium pallidum (strain ATCC 26659 / Pp 5 / PN500) TaxID=670386 RepID=D3BN65_HETP5|nr:hypothetical protein PPL_12643 [Heterostelium album PN500]EFA77427.1 hypothetical protein PPL_12643 [Heterostelium album PN500]|eukprot:XP_020429556.1 hypothetical protein PPL_12643 [Heterostelium album PN500]
MTHSTQTNSLPPYVGKTPVVFCQRPEGCVKKPAKGSKYCSKSKCLQLENKISLENSKGVLPAPLHDELDISSLNLGSNYEVDSD